MKKLILLIGVLLIAGVSAAYMNPGLHGSFGVVGGITCDPASNEVGDRADYTVESGALITDQCYAMLYTADCTGTLEYGTMMQGAAGTVSCKLCVYNDSGDGVPNDAADTLIGCTNAIATNGVGSFTSSNKVTGNVTQGTNYWVILIAGGSTLKPARTTSGAHTLYYGSMGAGSYNNPPANLSGLTLSTAGTRDCSMFVAIE